MITSWNGITGLNENIFTALDKASVSRGCHSLKYIYIYSIYNCINLSCTTCWWGPFISCNVSAIVVLASTSAHHVITVYLGGVIKI